jgi:hypothetical protein
MKYPIFFSFTLLTILTSSVAQSGERTLVMLGGGGEPAL